MADQILNTILREYEQKKIKAEMDLDTRKEKLYKDIPRLQEIENELNKFAIYKAKNLLLNNKNSIKEINEKIEILKNEKSSILKKENINLDFFEPKYECSICKDTRIY